MAKAVSSLLPHGPMHQGRRAPTQMRRAHPARARASRAPGNFDFEFERASRRDAHSEDRAGRPWACAARVIEYIVICPQEPHSHRIVVMNTVTMPSSHHDVPAHASLTHALLAADFRRRVSSLGSPRPRL